MESKLMELLMAALAGMGAQLLVGKAIKRLILWPIEVLASKTANKTDDEIVLEAQKDLGLEPVSKKEEDKQNG